MDEDVPVEIARSLRDAGYEALLVAQTLGKQTDDKKVWQYAVGSSALIVTCNRQDFLELAGTAPQTGLIILNRRKTRQAECSRILQLIRDAGKTGLANNINYA